MKLLEPAEALKITLAAQQLDAAVDRYQTEEQTHTLSRLGSVAEYDLQLGRPANFRSDGTQPFVLQCVFLPDHVVNGATLCSG